MEFYSLKMKKEKLERRLKFILVDIMDSLEYGCEVAEKQLGNVQKNKFHESNCF